MNRFVSGNSLTSQVRDLVFLFGQTGTGQVFINAPALTAQVRDMVFNLGGIIAPTMTSQVRDLVYLQGRQT